MRVNDHEEFPASIDTIDAMGVKELKHQLIDVFKLGATEASLRTVRKPQLRDTLVAAWQLANVTPERPVPEPAPAPDEAVPDAPPEPGPEDADPEPPGVELEVAAETVVPLPSRWQMIMDIADTVAMANLAPKDLRGRGNIGNARLVLLAANDLGIPITQAIQKLAPVNGRLVMAAELMAALIRRDGHLISVNESTWESCTITGQRVDTGESMTVTFDLSDAEAADLIQEERKPNGRPKARSQDGKPLPWELYTSDLLYARTLSRLARRLFPDCLGGISYTPEELGDTGDYAFGDQPDGEGGTGPTAAPAPEPTMSIEQQRVVFGERLAALPEDLAGEVRAEWKRRNLPKLAVATVGTLRTVRPFLERAETAALDRQAADDDQTEQVGADGQPIDEAEVVTEPEQASDPGPAETPDPAREPVNCAACNLPIAPGPAPDDLGDIVEQPVIAGDDKKPYHALCAPF